MLPKKKRRDQGIEALLAKRARSPRSDPLPPRVSRVKSPEEVANEAARRRRFEQIRNILLLTGPDDEVLGGPVLAKKLEQARAQSHDDGKEIEQCEEALSFTVGAKSFGKSNRRFDFPNGYRLVKQSASVYTIADDNIRVTLVRQPTDEVWAFESVMDLAAYRRRL